MKVDILTLFPAMFSGPFNESIVKRAIDKKLVEINFINIRDFATDKYGSVDDKPYGGGVGMIMRVDVVAKAIKYAKSKMKSFDSAQDKKIKCKTIFLDPRGETYNQAMARDFSKLDHLILICGHYEGVDKRIKEFVDESISIGDYVLTGGEIPAMVIVDSVVRLIPNVLAKPEAVKNESFSISRHSEEQSDEESPTGSFAPLRMTNLLEYPQYTRPEEFKGLKVPEVLLSGDHKKIEDWRKKNTKNK